MINTGLCLLPSDYWIQNELVTVFVCVEAILREGDGTPAVVAADAHLGVIDIEHGAGWCGQLPAIGLTGQFGGGVGGGIDAKRLLAHDTQAKALVVGDGEPADIDLVAVFLWFGVVDPVVHYSGGKDPDGFEFAVGVGGVGAAAIPLDVLKLKRQLPDGADPQ